MTVLVLSEDRDPTTDAVVDELNRRGVPLLRCDLGWFPQRLALDAELRGGGWSGTLRTPHREVALSGLRSVWYRSPTVFTFSDEMSVAERLHAAYEAKFGLGGVLWSLPLLWVNHPARQADLYKPTQLAVARACGLAVPETLVTNRPDAVRRFAASVGGPIVVKPMGFASIKEEGTRNPIYTHVVSGEDLADLRGVEATAHLFQRFIADKAYEVRLTIVGDHLFAPAIHAASHAARIGGDCATGHATGPRTMTKTETARANADRCAAVIGNGPGRRPGTPVQTRARIGRPARPLTPEVSARHRFGAELRRWRTQRGLTHRRLAALVWHSAESVAKVEKGERWPSLDLTLRCEQALGAGGALIALWPAVEQQRLANDGRRRPRRPRRPPRSPGVGEPLVQ